MSDGQQTPVSGAWTTESSASVDRYERLGLLGEGGMGSVWRARDRALNRDVAYKTVSPDASTEVRDRLVQEARIAANLAGTGCISVFDHGTAADGRPYYTMEMLTFPAFGGDASQTLRQLLDVATTLGAAHARGIVHRDVKPSNVGLAGTRAVLADWGLARPVEAISEWDQSILTQARPRTSTGLAMGTAGYMAPEQLTGAPASLRADVWSLGAMLYDLIADGRLKQGGGHTLMGQVVAGTVAFPDTGLGRLARSALSLDPEARPPNAAVFADTLRGCLEPPKTTRPSLVWVVAVAVVAVAGGLVAGWMLVPDFRPQASQSTASLAWSRVDAGRRHEARVLGLQADAALSSPESRGLLTLPPSSSTEATAYPSDCPRWVLDDRQPLAVCVRPDMVAAYASDGSVRWEVQAAETHAVRSSAGRVTFAGSFENVRVAPDGTAQRMQYSATESLVSVGDEWVVKTGDLLRRISVDGTVRDDLADGVDQLVGAVGMGSVSAERGQLVLRDGPRTSMVFVGQLVVAMRDLGEVVLVVGERGLVLELDRESWTERRRYALPGRGGVLAAAIGPLGEVVWSTRHGVLRASNGIVTDQVSMSSAVQLSVDEQGRVWGQTDGQLWQWRSTDEGRHVYEPLNASTTGLSRNGPYLAVGTDDERLLTVIPGSGESRASRLDGENVRDMFVTPTGSYAVAGGSLVRGGRDPLTYEQIGSAALLGDGTIIGVARWGPGVSWLKDDIRHHERDTELFRSVQSDVSGEFAIARTIDGDLWRIDPDHSLTPLSIAGVSAFTGCEAGLVVARGSVVSIPGASDVDVGEPVTALIGDRDFVVVGTRFGTIWVLSHDGDRLARMQAHGERISALTLFADDLFTGSWEPGVRRWQLAALRP